MTSLTRAKKMTQVALIGLGVGIVLLIVGSAGIKLLGYLTGSNKPQQVTIVPTVGFGQVSAPKLTPVNINTATATFELDLVNGAMPQSTASAKVYKVANPALSLTAQDRARSRAKNLGFTNPPTQPSPDSFLWDDGIRHLNLSLKDQTFNLSTDLNRFTLSDRQSFNRFTPIAQQVTSFAQNQFEFTDLDYADPQIVFGTPTADTFYPQPDTAITTTNYAQATLLRQKLDGLPVYSAQGKFGPITMVIVPPKKPTGSDDNTDTSQLQIDQILQMTNQYFPIDQNSASTYPVITPQDAYTELQKNVPQYLVYVEPTDGTTPPASLISGRVLFVTLVYLEPDINNTQYVQPVWMFEGRGTADTGDVNWVAYVPAVDQTATAQLLAGKK